MKLFVIVMLIAIIASLGSGLFFLSRDEQGSERMLNALKLRVLLSAVLLGVLLLAWFMGWLGTSGG